jgi:hypothetical protein
VLVEETEQVTAFHPPQCAETGNLSYASSLLRNRRPAANLCYCHHEGIAKARIGAPRRLLGKLWHSGLQRRDYGKLGSIRGDEQALVRLCAVLTVLVGKMSAFLPFRKFRARTARYESALSRRLLVPPAGIEPATPGLGNLCSIH